MTRHHSFALTAVCILSLGLAGNAQPTKGVLQHHGAKKGGVWTSPPALVQFRNISIEELR